MMKYYKFICKICGEAPFDAQEAISIYGRARLTTAFYHRFAKLLYEELNVPFRQMITPYGDLSGLLGGARGYLVLPSDPFVLMEDEEKLPQIESAARQAFSQSAVDFLGNMTSSSEAEKQLSPYAQLCIRQGDEEPKNVGGDVQVFRKMIHQSPLTAPLWRYLTARQKSPTQFGWIQCQIRQEPFTHYERRQWAGKRLSVGETAARMIEGAGGFVLAAGGTKIIWLCPAENAKALSGKLRKLTEENQF